MAARFLSSGEHRTLHKARSFSYAPDAEGAAALLAELATAACAYAPVTPDSSLGLYGAGNLGLLAREFLTAVGREFCIVVDRNAQEIEREPRWSGVSLVHPNDVPVTAKRGLRLAVSIVTSPYVPIERSLLALGFEDVVPFYDLVESFRDRHPLSNGWFASPFGTLDQEKIAEVLSLWDDNVSRAHHLQFLAWRRLRQEWTFESAPIPACSRFFIPEVVGALRGDECLLDGGAHHGSVIEAFVKQTKECFRQIVAIEPDPLNRALLIDNLQTLLPGNQHVEIYDCVLADGKNSTLFHEGLGYTSQLSPTGQMRVVTQPLDTLGLSPTFLKLHLEGAELLALKGARETLLSCRPIIATTVYHNEDGLWKTPLWMMQTLPDYRFLFRAHSWCGTGAVVYAIPNERTNQTPRL